ncbi:exodeoxyribonuclease V subunit alpha [Vibrio sp. WJH972]
MSELENMDLLVDLDTLLNHGIIRQIDRQSARFFSNIESTESEAIAWLTALLSRELGLGHSCIQLIDHKNKFDFHLLTFGLNLHEFVGLKEKVVAIDWLSVLTQSDVIGKEGEEKPLVFDGERLYFHRYWHYETSLMSHLHHFGSPIDLDDNNIHKLSLMLDRLFGREYGYLHQALGQCQSKNQYQERQNLVCDILDVVNQNGINWELVDAQLMKVNTSDDLQFLDKTIPQSNCLNWQKVAAAVALSRRFTVISGGPGTGKTTTVAKLLAALVLQEKTEQQCPNICLVAPTGKAAARLTESIGNAIGRLPIDSETKSQIPVKASTIHRLLGSIPNSTQFRHHSNNKLHLDILVVDEASMVDLPMMTKLFDALPSHARVILLGDKDQLASVEAGAVLGDICSFLSVGYSAKQSTLLSTLTGFSIEPEKALVMTPQVCDSLCMLRKSYRFDQYSGIGQLAKAVNLGDAASAEAVFDREFEDITMNGLTGEGLSSLLSLLHQEYRCYLELAHQLPLSNANTTLAAQELLIKPILKAFNQCRLLCAVREGEYGVMRFNQQIERVLVKHRLISPSDDIWYIGRPIMILKNDYNLGLYNGDIGVCLPDLTSDEPRLKVYFELPDGTVKGILPSRIPQHELAYAMTIHKSQGSEFATTLMVLPKNFSPVLTRELVYTGITRAKSELYLYTDMGVFRRAVGIKTERVSGLTDRLEKCILAE